MIAYDNDNNSNNNYTIQIYTRLFSRHIVLPFGAPCFFLSLLRPLCVSCILYTLVVLPASTVVRHLVVALVVCLWLDSFSFWLPFVFMCVCACDHKL